MPTIESLVIARPPQKSGAGFSSLTREELEAELARLRRREALFDALANKEVYASTGPRIKLRFFGGWDFEQGDADSAELANIGYDKGVPMGGQLQQREDGSAPKFIVGRTSRDFSATETIWEFFRGKSR